MAWVEVEFTNADLWDNGYDGTGNPPYSAFSRLRLTTYSANLKITATTTAFSITPSFAVIGVFKDGSLLELCEFEGDGQDSFDIALGSGTKTIDIVNANHILQGLTVYGTYIDTIEVDSGADAAFVTPQSPSLLVYGDSIAGGTMGANWALTLRYTYSRNVAIEAWGGRHLEGDASTAGLRAATVARLSAYDPTDVWISIGVNDWTRGTRSVASFAADYESIIDALHAELPTAKIYCQSILDTDEGTANAQGDTKQDFRDAVENACDGRTWATFVDGTTILDASEMTGVHPLNAAAYTKYGDYAEAILTGTSPAYVSAYVRTNFAYDMNGVNHYLTAPQAIATEVYPEGAIAAWVRPDVAPSEAANRAIVWWAMGSSTFRFYKTAVGNQVQLYIDGRYRSFDVTAKWSSGNWMLWIAQWRLAATEVWEFYIDGIAQSALSPAGTLGSNTPSSVIGIGASNSGLYKFDGAIGRLCVWNRRLTATEIEALQEQLPIDAADRRRVLELAPGSAVSQADNSDVFGIIGSPPAVDGPTVWDTYVNNTINVWKVPYVGDSWIVPR